ncbi:MAG: DNA alkylation repair protein [bacterium]
MLHATIRGAADPARAVAVARFFKTGPGQYGEGDQFLGITVPALRKMARAHRELSLPDAIALLHSPWHEERLVALLILVGAHERGTSAQRTRICKAYLANTACVNNWDLVDCSAEELVGSHIAEQGIPLLERLARSTSVWERRIAIIATFSSIKQGEFAPTLAIAKVLLLDEHDLIHKAVGWMLREVGKRDDKVVRRFLDRYAATMPRVALRYAIERMSPADRKYYLAMGKEERR